MTYKEVEGKIVKIFMEHFKVDGVDIYSTFKEINMDFDDLDFVEILMVIEDQFDIFIDDVIADKWKILKDIIDHVSDRTGVPRIVSRFEIMDI